ncbi:helix-turn-helix domain-containing protein [Actinomycetes bacterium KLBMP 9759]
MADQREPRELTDAAAIRALRHPLRQRILRRLHREGPATATSLARALGENTGATSYHLRQLAEHGFVQDDPEHASGGRERWWRAPRQDLRFPPRSRMSDEMRHEIGQMEQHNAAEDVEAVARFEAQRDRMGEWGDALLIARGELTLSPEQLLRFWNDYLALFNRYVAEGGDGPAARSVLVRFMAFPDVDAD